MDYSTIVKNQSVINSLINQKRLKEALDMINNHVKDTHNSELIDAAYNIEITYKSLLKYTVEGFTDPERQKIYNQLVADIFKLADDVFIQMLTTIGHGMFFEIRRLYVNSQPSFFLDTLEKCKSHFEQRNLMQETETPFCTDLNNSIQTLFELMFTQTSVYKLNGVEINNVFKNNELPWPQQSILVSAATMYLMNHFNIDAINFLFCLAENENLQIKQRALTGLLIILYKYDSRLVFFPEVTNRIKTLSENKSTLSIVRTVIIQIMRTRETEKLAKKFTDEILPEVAKIHPNLRNRLDLDNIIGENFMEGKNPDWEDIFSDSPDLMNKLEELTKLQMEGSDLFLSTFRMLKHFPFFNYPSNWFLPFSHPNPVVNDILKNESGAFKNPDLIKSMSESGILCNSDKYSLMLSIPQMPAMQKDMMGQMFMAEIGAISEIENSDSLIDPEKKALSVSNQYIQDLYRFFKVHPQKNSFEDPFSWPLDFHNKWFVNNLFVNDDFFSKLGEYLFEKDRYAEALETFNILEKRTNPSMQLLQKQAFCLQQSGDYEQALKLYLQADLFEHSQAWNLKKIALCYRHLKNSEKALEFYLEAERADPQNLHTQVSIGHCLFETKNYTEALKYYFKVEYLDPKNSKVWRPIVWCALALGKFEAAEKYCQMVIDNEPSANDYLNMGHIAWCQANRKNALMWYQKCVKHPKNSLNEFVEALDNDRYLLIEHNVDQSDIPIMIDQLRYYLQE